MIYPTTQDLLRLLVGSVLLGVCFCLVYDLLRIARLMAGIGEGLSSRPALPYPRGMEFRISPSRGWSNLLINLGDILFFLFCGVTLAIYLSAADHGRIRWLAPIGLGSGFLLCRMTLSTLVLRLGGFAAEILRFLLAWAVWGICRPVCVLCAVCRRAGRFVGGVLFSLWLPRYTQWKMRQSLGCLKRFYHDKRRTHHGTM